MERWRLVLHEDWFYIKSVGIKESEVVFEKWYYSNCNVYEADYASRIADALGKMRVSFENQLNSSVEDSKIELIREIKMNKLEY